MRSVSGITTNQDHLSKENQGEFSLSSNSILQPSESSEGTFPNHYQSSLSTEPPRKNLQSRNATGNCRQRGVTTHLENFEGRQSSSKVAVAAKATLIVFGVIAALYLAYSLGHANGSTQNQCLDESIQQIRQCTEMKTRLINQCYEEKRQLIAECAADMKEWYAKGKEACEANARLERAIQRM